MNKPTMYVIPAIAKPIIINTQRGAIESIKPYIGQRKLIIKLTTPARLPETDAGRTPPSPLPNHSIKEGSTQLGKMR